MTITRRMNPEDRKAALLESGLVLLETYGLKAVQRITVAAEVGVTDGLVSKYFGTRNNLRGEVLGLAVARKNIKALAMAIKDGFTLEGVAPKMLKEAETMAAKL